MAEADEGLVLLAEWQVSVYVAGEVDADVAAEVEQRALAALKDATGRSARVLAAYSRVRVRIKVS